MSPPSIVAAFILIHFKINYKDKEVNLAAGAHQKKPFLKINPDGVVPAIRIGNLCLNEGISICRFLIESNKIDTPFYPYKDAKSLARVDQMIEMSVGDYRTRMLRLYFNTVVGPTFFGVPKPTIAEKEEYMNDVYDSFSMLESILSNSRGDYILGDNFTLADLNFWIFTMIVTVSAGAKLTGHPKVQKWYENIEAIPEVAKLLKKRNKVFGKSMFLGRWILPLCC
jgi:glutathione S-transferase